MATVVGFDPKVKAALSVTCQSCGAIIQYEKREIRERKYTCMGDPSGHEYVVCPHCNDDAKISSW